MVRDSSLGDIQGFSHHLTALAHQDTDGLWLSYIRLSSLGDNTVLEGQALRADLVPAYLERLAEELPFASQRFNQFQIERPEDEGGDVVTFLVNRDEQLLTDVLDSQ